MLLVECNINVPACIIIMSMPNLIGRIYSVGNLYGISVHYLLHSFPWKVKSELVLVQYKVSMNSAYLKYVNQREVGLQYVLPFEVL